MILNVATVFCEMEITGLGGSGIWLKNPRFTIQPTETNKRLVVVMLGHVLFWQSVTFPAGSVTDKICATHGLMHRLSAAAVARMSVSLRLMGTVMLNNETNCCCGCVVWGLDEVVCCFEEVVCVLTAVVVAGRDVNVVTTCCPHENELWINVFPFGHIHPHDNSPAQIAPVGKSDAGHGPHAVFDDCVQLVVTLNPWSHWLQGVQVESAPDWHWAR